jgi:hypothetical protein
MSDFGQPTGVTCHTGPVDTGVGHIAWAHPPRARIWVGLVLAAAVPFVLATVLWWIIFPGETTAAGLTVTLAFGALALVLLTTFSVTSASSAIRSMGLVPWPCAAMILAAPLFTLALTTTWGTGDWADVSVWTNAVAGTLLVFAVDGVIRWVWRRFLVIGVTRRASWIRTVVTIIVAIGLVPVMASVTYPRGADGPYMTMPPTCSLLDPASVSAVMSMDVNSYGDFPGTCEWATTINGNTMFIGLQADLATSGPGHSAIANGRRIFGKSGSSYAMDLTGLADEATEHIYYHGTTIGTTVTVRSANLLLELHYKDDRAKPGYVAEVAEVLARQALRKAVGDVVTTGSGDGKQASTRPVQEVTRSKQLVDPAEARYRKPVARAVGPPVWMASDQTAMMGFLDDFAFKVPDRTGCDFLGTHWRCDWAVPGVSIAVIDISLQHCSPDCQDDWPFRAVEADWHAEDPATQVSTKTFDKVEINGVTYRDHVQVSMKRTTPGYHVDVQVIVPESRADIAHKIINDIRNQ